MIENARVEIFQTGSMVNAPKQINETIRITKEPNWPEVNPTRYVHYLTESPFIDGDHPFVINGFLKTLTTPGNNQYRMSYDFDDYTKDGVEFYSGNAEAEITIQYWGMGGNLRKENLYREMWLSGKEALNVSLDGNNPPKIDADFICQCVSDKFLVQNIYVETGMTFAWGSGLFPAKENSSTYYLYVNLTGQFGAYKDTGSNAPVYKTKKFGWYDASGNHVIAKYQVLSDGSVGFLIKYSNSQAQDISGVTGNILMFGGSTVPTGYLMCDGAEVSRSTYAALFAIIGTTFGSGDGSTTFKLPDFRGVFPKGAGTTDRTAGKDASGNFYAGTLGNYSQDKMQGHRHNQQSASSGGSGLLTEGGSSFHAISSSDPITDNTNGLPRTGHTTEPQSLGINFIIKC